MKVWQISHITTCIQQGGDLLTLITQTNFGTLCNSSLHDIILVCIGIAQLSACHIAIGL